MRISRCWAGWRQQTSPCPIHGTSYLEIIGSLQLAVRQDVHLGVMSLHLPQGLATYMIGVGANNYGYSSQSNRGDLPQLLIYYLTSRIGEVLTRVPTGHRMPDGPSVSAKGSQRKANTPDTVHPTNEVVSACDRQLRPWWCKQRMIRSIIEKAITCCKDPAAAHPVVCTDQLPHCILWRYGLRPLISASAWSPRRWAIITGPRRGPFYSSRQLSTSWCSTLNWPELVSGRVVEPLAVWVIVLIGLRHCPGRCSKFSNLCTRCSPYGIITVKLHAVVS